MPSAATIVQQLTLISREWSALAIAWHVVLAVVLLLLWGGRFRPSERLGAALLSLPAVSVGLLAWTRGNPFNTGVFLVLAALMLVLSAGLSGAIARPGPRWMQAAGALTLAYAWFYPQFLATDPVWQVLLVAPMGLIPCPTLALIIGFGLWARGFRSRAWCALLGGVGVFYGLFGMLRLWVWLDLGLLMAAITLLAAAFSPALGRGRMQPHADERALIDDFLACRRVALVGASSRPEHFSRMVLRALVAQGIDVVPIHPSADRIEDRRTFPSLDPVDPPVEAALIMTPAQASAAVVDACIQAGIRRVWLHRGAGPGAVSEEAIAHAERAGLALVAGRCPLMFLGDEPAAIHRAHAAMLRWVGRYPARQTS